jgi:hypothetical protein
MAISLLVTWNYNNSISVCREYNVVGLLKHARLCNMICLRIIFYFFTRTGYKFSYSCGKYKIYTNYLINIAVPPNQDGEHDNVNETRPFYLFCA